VATAQTIEQFQPVHIPRNGRSSRKRFSSCCSCSGIILAPILLGLVILAVYLLAPFRTTLLVLGIDRVPDGTAVGRSDTMILVSVNPLLPTVKMLSIPRDLWVSIPGVGENRINTAHFFAEASRPGSGPQAAVETVAENFGIRADYYARVRFDAFQGVVDALGGVDINLPEDMAGLPAGPHHLDGAQALAFVRDRKGTDDFFRMSHTQLLIKAIAGQALSPSAWPRLPAVTQAALASIDSNLPLWQWPRLGLAFVRAALGNQIDNQTIRREMTTPFITDGGANVLLPNWDLIHPFVNSFFQ
jgi:polyisoprenyl-teichoic acid--peptidoglycan teichoic acid transferase